MISKHIISECSTEMKKKRDDIPNPTLQFPNVGK